MSAAEAAYQRCINPSCAATFGVAEVLHTCPRCDGLLDVAYEWDRLEAFSIKQPFAGDGGMADCGPGCVKSLITTTRWENFSIFPCHKQ